MWKKIPVPPIPTQETKGEVSRITREDIVLSISVRPPAQHFHAWAISWRNSRAHAPGDIAKNVVHMHSA